MNLKNYTSSVAAHTTIANIEAFLIDAGATGISKKIYGGQVIAIVFEIADEDNLKRIVKLPANAESVLNYLWDEYKGRIVNQTRKTKEDFIEQANRTAWKIC
jgi:hypothetical protein